MSYSFISWTNMHETLAPCLKVIFRKIKFFTFFFILTLLVGSIHHFTPKFRFWILSKFPRPPPFPKFGQIVPLFLNAEMPKKLGRGLPLPPHPQIDPIYTVCEKWKKVGQNPKEQLLFFVKPSLSALQHFFIGPESDHWLCLSLTH